MAVTDHLAPVKSKSPVTPSASVTSVRRFIVMNSKGGCGKTTVATNLASYYRTRGLTTALYDLDPQGSSERWARLRPSDQGEVPGIAGYQSVPSSVTSTWLFRVPSGTERIIIDTPAAPDRTQLAEQVRGVDAILIPVMPSSIDTFAAADFIRDLLLLGKTRTHQTRVGIIANRVKEGTLAFQNLERFLLTLQIPVVAYLRDTQHYVHAAECGLGIHEMESSRTRKDVVAWTQIYNWLENDDTP